MKKVVFGCLALVLVVAIGGAVAAYYFVYRPASAYVAGFGQWKEVLQMNSEVQNTAAFTPPANGELTPERVTQLVSVQRAVQDGLGPRLDELEAKYDAMEREIQARGGTPSIGALTTALKDLASLVKEAKRLQVDALNQNGLSLAEYEWTRSRAYAAAGIPVNFSITSAIADIVNGQQPDLEQAVNAMNAEVPPRNRELIAPHQEQLARAAGLAFFGL